MFGLSTKQTGFTKNLQPMDINWPPILCYFFVEMPTLGSCKRPGKASPPDAPVIVSKSRTSKNFSGKGC